MRIVLVGAGLEENLSLRYLVPPLRRAGHEVELASFDDAGDRERLAERMAVPPPDLVGMSVAFQHRLGDFRSLAADLRARGVAAAIVWGGHIPTARAGQLLNSIPELDLVVRHDGEATLAEAVAALAEHPLGGEGRGRRVEGELLRRLSAVDGLAFRLPNGEPGATEPRAALRDLDALDWPARDGAITRHAGLGFVPVVGSRGCWQHCTYCSIQTYHRGRKGPRLRFREPAEVAAEMADLYHHRQARIFCFHDENFFLPGPAATMRRLGELQAGLSARGVGKVGLVAKCRPDELSPELLRAACRMGLLRVYVGIENGSQPGLDHLGRHTTVATCRAALDMLRDAGLYSCFNVLLFEPDTTMQDVADNLAFLEHYCDFPWNFCRTEVYPGSFLEERLRSQGRLRGGLDGMTYTIADPLAELLFRVTAVAFGNRNFGPTSTANAASGLGYLAALMTRFFPGRAATRYARETQDVVLRLGRDTLSHLGEAHRFVAAGRQTDAAVTRFAADLAARVLERDARFWCEIERLRLEMNRYGVQHAAEVLRPTSLRKALLQAAAVVAAAGLATVACGKGDKSEVMDPLPPDQTDGRGEAEMQVVDPLVPDLVEAVPEVPVVDPLPPDMMDAKGETDYQVVDPLPPDIIDAKGETDHQVVDPLPWDMTDAKGETDYQVVDPLPPDLVVDDVPPDLSDAQGPDVLIVDPPPPDIQQETDETDGTGKDVPPPVDPLPPDMGAGYGSESQGPAAPPPLPIDRAFRVHLSAARDGDVVVLTASVCGAKAVRLAWKAFGGRLVAEGTGARFVPDGTRPPAVLVTAQAGNQLVDCAAWLPG